jgi:hypothetical protein
VIVGFEVTVLHKDGGPLTKRIGLAGGVLCNDASSCRMSRGWATRARCKSVEHLAELINRCGPNEALAIGRLRADLARKVQIVRKCELEKHDGAVARSIEYFEFADGPGVCLIDVDLKGAPAGLDAMDALLAVLPDLYFCPFVQRASTLHGIRNKENGAAYPGPLGQHIYLPVKDQRDVPRFLRDLQDRLWLAGHGWGLVSAAGSFLVRSPVDTAVGSPERLVFEGKPTLAKLLIQADRPATVCNPRGRPLDTTTACPP